MADPTKLPELSAEAKQAISALNADAAGALKVSSNFAKMKITPYEVNNDRREYFEPLKVDINPESYTRRFSSRIVPPVKEVSGKQQEEKVIEFSETVSFDLWFDNTGAIPNSTDVNTGIKWLEDNLVKFDGSMHATRFVKLFWGTLTFFGQLKSLDVQYLYFNRNGEPLRAKASLSFEKIVERKVKVQERGEQSPDLTHRRVVKAGENLPMLCNKIYNTPHCYMQVAEANGLANFTDVRPGQVIYFPPLKT
ncbi:MAG: peptidoglycan-binding protein [Thermoanaerobaculia bacterium]|nr:peptidoglycan-binding protein [Thermoanaerobaculia bacterium]